MRAGREEPKRRGTVHLGHCNRLPVLVVEEAWYLAVEARPEPVLALFPESYEAAVRIAFDVGNRHFSLGADGDTLLVPDDTAMEDLVRRLGVRWERREVVYSPLHGGGDG